MKKNPFITYLFLSISLLFTIISSHAQDKPRVSPPAQIKGIAAGSDLTISYSQPSVKGRKIWGQLVPFNKVWRTGANEATTFETSKDIKVEGQSLPKGTYGLFTIPGETEWTIIFNKKADQWGAYEYDEKKDQLRVKVKPGKAPAFVETLTFFIEGNKVFFRWENLQVGFNVSE